MVDSLFIDELKERINIVDVINQDVPLKKDGVRFSGLCPFHDEKTPSFKVDPNKQFFHCFGCGASGDVIKFVRERHNLQFMEAIERLAGEIGLTVPKNHKSSRTAKYDPLYAVMEKAAAIYHAALTDKKKGKRGREYLQGRDIPNEIIEKYQLGIAPDPNRTGWQFLVDQFTVEEQKAAIEVGLIVEKKGRVYDRFRNRIVLPVYNSTGRVIAFTGRTLDESQAKYINSPESPIFSKKRTLLGLFQHRNGIKLHRKILLIEGGFDLLSLARHGIEYSCAPMGTALTSEQLDLVSRLGNTEVIFLFDGDQAGLRAMYRSSSLFLEKNIACKVVRMPDDHDPDSFIAENGRAAFDEVILSGIPLVEFIAEELLAANHGEVGESFVKELHQLVGSCSSSLIRQRLLQGVAKRLGVDEALLVQEFTLDKEEKGSHGTPRVPAAKMGEGLQTQFSRRIIAFLLHYPEKYTELKKAAFQIYCSDTFGHHVCQVFRKTGNDFDLHEMFNGSQWWPEIQRILSPDSVDSQLLQNVSPENELSVLFDWFQQQEQSKEATEYRTRMLSALERGDLPPIS